MGKLIAVNIPKIATWGQRHGWNFPGQDVEKEKKRGIGHALETLQEGDRNKWEDEKEQFETSEEN